MGLGGSVWDDLVFGIGSMFNVHFSGLYVIFSCQRDKKMIMLYMDVIFHIHPLDEAFNFLCNVGADPLFTPFHLYSSHLWTYSGLW